MPATERALGVAELVLAIAAHLDCPADLARAARLSRAWRCGAEEALYRELRLWGIQRVERLVRTVTGQPRLGRLARELSFQVEDGPPRAPPDRHMLQLQTTLVSACPNVKRLLVEGRSERARAVHPKVPWEGRPGFLAYAGDGGGRMGQLVATVGLYSTHLVHLWVNGINELDTLAPYLASFSHLRYLLINAHAHWGDSPVAWPKPTFELSTLSFTYAITIRNADPPDIDQFQWLTDSSRNSLRHLELEGFAPDVVGELAA